MSHLDFRKFIEPDKIPRFTKAQSHVTFENYPPPLEPILGMWGPLSKEPFSGITSDGTLIKGCYAKQPNAAPIEAAAQAAISWLSSLSKPIRSKVQFEVDSKLWTQWHNVPLILRKGQTELVELNDMQRHLALQVVKASLSSEGYRRTREIMDGNLFLGKINRLTDLMNRWSFTLSIFGTPSTSNPWGWQLFGHHLSLNCLFIDGQMVLSPVFMGLEPDLELGVEDRCVFKPHEESALAMFQALSDSQKTKAVLYDSMLTANQPKDRFHPDDGRQVGGAFQDNRIVPYEGIGVTGFDHAQRMKLLELSEQFICNMPSGPAKAKLNEIEKYLDQTYFSWIGKANEIDPFYFRIHSPVTLIEFDHHSGIFLANEEPARFHVHTIVRSPNGGDYGKNLLRDHYAKGGHDHKGGKHSHDGGKTFHSHD